MGHTHKKNEDLGKKTSRPKHNPYKRLQYNLDPRIGKNVSQSPSLVEEVFAEIDNAESDVTDNLTLLEESLQVTRKAQ